MIASHIAQLRRVVDETPNLPESTRAELLQLVRALEADLAKADSQQAQDSEVENGEGNGRDSTVLHQLRQSIEELEATHPETAAVVSRVATVLANMGI